MYPSLKKLPKLGTKLRQEIKLEPISETSSISTNSKKSDSKENDFNSINIKREKISIGVRSQVSHGSSDPDSSILVIPNEVNIITLSDDDDDDDNKMPPPMMPAPKKLPTKKTRNNEKSSILSESEPETNSSQSTDTSSSQLQPKKTRKGKKTKKPVLPIQEIKQEKVEEVALTNGLTSESQKATTKKSSEKVDTGSKNATLESVYEDASDKIPSVSHSNQKILYMKLSFCFTYVSYSNQQVDYQRLQRMFCRKVRLKRMVMQSSHLKSTMLVKIRLRSVALSLRTIPTMIYR